MIDLGPIEELTRNAVKHFWTSRKTASEGQTARGSSDQGTRSEVTSGKHMDGFVQLIREVALRNGLQEGGICSTKWSDLRIPGFFRAHKKWDMLLYRNEDLIAALEFKSMKGSEGNNLNNRAEEAVGLAEDFWVAYRENAFRTTSPPFLGFLVVLADKPSLSNPVRPEKCRFPQFKEFDESTYVDRWNLLCRKLVEERMFSRSAFLLTEEGPGSETGEYREIETFTSIKSFLTGLAGHIAGTA